MDNLKNKIIRGGLAKVSTQVASLALPFRLPCYSCATVGSERFWVDRHGDGHRWRVNLFKDAGLSMATIQCASISDKQMSTLFWINVLVGFLLALLLTAFAPLIATFYSEPRLFWLRWSCLLNFCLSGLLRNTLPCSNAKCGLGVLH